MAASILSDMRGETNNINRAIRVIAGLLILLSLALGVSASSLYYFQLLVVVDRFCRGQPVPERPDHMVSDGKNSEESRRGATDRPIQEQARQGKTVKVLNDHTPARRHLLLVAKTRQYHKPVQVRIHPGGQNCGFVDREQ